MDSSEEMEIMNTKMTGRMAQAARMANSRLYAAFVQGFTRLICREYALSSFFMASPSLEHSAVRVDLGHDGYIST